MATMADTAMDQAHTAMDPGCSRGLYRGKSIRQVDRHKSVGLERDDLGGQAVEAFRNLRGKAMHRAAG